MLAGLILCPDLLPYRMPDTSRPWRDVASLLAIWLPTGLGIVRTLGTTVVAGSVSKNPLFTSVAVLVTLLVWVNLIARILLLAAAWTADPPYVEPPGRRG